MSTDRQPEGAPPALSYQPQHLWSDGEFDMWSNIGAPTISKIITRERLVAFLAIHPDDKVRVLKIVSSAEVIDFTAYDAEAGHNQGRPPGVADDEPNPYYSPSQD